MDPELLAHNRACRDWADKQPPKFRDALLAFAYPCDKYTLSWTETVQWFSDNTRKPKYPGKFVGVRTLFNHLKVFRKHGLITRELCRNGDKQEASVYTMHLDAVIGQPSSHQDEPASEPLPKAKANGHPHEPKAKIAKRIEAVVHEHYELEEPIDEESPADKRFRLKMEAERAEAEARADALIAANGGRDPWAH